ncbi:uncharacterized protein METZ01_LOCUS511522, partial [marine metagenome]
RFLFVRFRATPDANTSIAIDAARCGETVFNNVVTDSKVLVTKFGKEWKIDLDYLLEGAILEEIESKSSYPILSEESVSQQRFDCPYWIVDPLDGSANCLRGIPMFAISIALWNEDRPVLGVILDLIRSELFYGSDKCGAWCNDSQIYVAEENLRENAILNTGFPSALNIDSRYLAKIAPVYRAFGKVRMFGSAALSLAFVACGKSDSYFEEDIAIWDVAAGLALVRAAGG